MGNFMWLCQIRSMILVLFFLFVVDCSPSLSSSSLNQTPLCLPEDSSALLQFKNTISIDVFGSDITSYPKTDSWNESTNCCAWEGVTCDNATGGVIGLDLSRSKLVGSLSPNTTLFRLQGLKQLNLAHNYFNGSMIPSGFSQLVSLTHLNLSSSYFSGLVPSDISLLSKLISLDLSNNYYRDCGLEACGLKLESHSFGVLTSNLSKLQNLFLDIVSMSDVVPTTSFLNLSSSLKRLSLSRCDLQGELPSKIFQLPYLEYLDLSTNSLTGYLPNSNWSSPLRLLDLSGNQLRGSIPASLRNLTKITSLDLSYNGFQGQIPDVFGDLEKLTTLDFSYCSFSGLLPSSLFNLTHLTSLKLFVNRIEGTVPTHIGRLRNLEYFCLNDNFLSGAIPSDLFTLPSLVILDLSNNRFIGPINQIQKPNSFQEVYLQNNEIHGEIPTSLVDLTNLTTLNLSKNNLSGVIMADMLSKLESLEFLDLSSNKLEVRKMYALSMLTNLSRLDLSNNKLISLGRENGVNSSFQNLALLFLSSCNLTEFPSFLRSAKKLAVLDLSNNKIEGSIFKWETEGWEQLGTLDLSHNSLTSLEQFPGKNLERLDLRSNSLQGPLPGALPSSIREFYISENKLTGEIPPSICNLASLEILDLSRNYFGGMIPACLGNLSSLTTISLQMNNFHGEIPDSFCAGDGSLTTVALNDNLLEGLLPRSLVNCSSLVFLNLENNKLNDLFPSWLGVLPNLKVLILGSNRFHGRLDNSMAMASWFSTLQVIDLSGNNFSGFLPTKFFQSLRAMKVEVHDFPVPVSCDRIPVGSLRPCISNLLDYYKNFVEVTMKTLKLEILLDQQLLLTGFTFVDFSKNQFHGRIPAVLGELRSLLALNLSHNSLTGPLPPSLGNISALESLDLSSNRLSGRIPSELTKLTFLAVLNLSRNNLAGPIPSGKQFNTFDNDSYAGNLDLCDFPLSKPCGNGEGSKPPAHQRKEDEGSPIPFFWKLVMMGYGCGVVLGVSTAYIVFTTGRPWWFVRIVERDWQRNVTRWICRIRGKRNMH